MKEITTAVYLLARIISTLAKIKNSITHIIPFGLKNKPPVIQSFIRALIPWIPDEFFDGLDCCENAIYLNPVAHNLFGDFKWFIVMEENENDPNQNIYRAMQVEGTGLLRALNTGRPQDDQQNNIIGLNSSYNQPLFIGTLHPRPAKLYIKLHELLARIIYMRGGADHFQVDNDDYDGEEVSLHEEIAEENRKLEEINIYKSVQT